VAIVAASYKRIKAVFEPFLRGNHERRQIPAPTAKTGNNILAEAQQRRETSVPGEKGAKMYPWVCGAVRGIFPASVSAS